MAMKKLNNRQVRKQLRWAGTVTTHDAAAVKKLALSEQEKQTFWYSNTDFNAFAQQNCDLVEYARSAAPENDDEWSQLEYGLNKHGHSMRGLERLPGMPHSQERERKRELAIYGVIEASMDVYRGDYAKIAMIARRLSDFAVKTALDTGALDELALVIFPEEKTHANASTTGKAAEEVTTSPEQRPSALSFVSKKHRRRGSLGQDLMKTIKRFPRRMSLQT
uniref:Uncharacterized protein n=1 Tax=Leptocylindrus danicus TaxID=163516 RepID=A0A7S2LJE2_9STRA